ncbi:MAG: methionine--tRNA ligase subunit beta, partial [Calditerrivibrio sp.]|nr:methionine--tRNA ligase subunit beta [Calditerrivibrio sp.]
RTSFKWGIPVPGDPKHIIYVWIDALSNYISALGYPNVEDLFGKYWPANYHIVGKDILRFHTVYWPTMLMSIGIPLPKSVFAHGWWTVEGQKMSKSLGNAIDPNWLVEKFGVDQIRYFLMREVPFGLDGDFSFKALIHRVNSDLSNDLGNLLNRTLGMLGRYFDGVVQPYTVSDEADDKIADQIINTFKEIDKNLNELAFNKALIVIWDLIGALNKYIDTMAPWSLAKDPNKKDRLGSVLYTVLDGIRALSLMLYPFMPSTALEIRRQLNTKREIYKSTFDDLLKVRVLEHGQKIGEIKQLFPRIEEEKLQFEIKKETEETKQSEMIDYDYFSKMQLKAAKIIAAEKVEKSEKLLKLKVDLGNEQKQIIAGIAKSYAPEELLGKTVVIVSNLKPAKLMGLTSEGMVLAAFDGEKHHVVELPDNVPAGSIVK